MYVLDIPLETSTMVKHEKINYSLALFHQEIHNLFLLLLLICFKNLSQNKDYKNA